MTHSKKQPYKRIALALSLCALILWGILGTGASLAWFSDATPEINNIFHFADFDLAVSYQLTDGTWKEIEGDTEIFDKDALYEPGYVQVVYLKVDNRGDRDFKFYTAVNVNGIVTATNVFGHTFSLQDYLRFGVVAANTPQAMKDSVPDRAAAVAIADMPLHNYDTDAAELKAGKSAYMALVVRMPENVGNIANYRGDTPPKVELGITVKADQIID